MCCLGGGGLCLPHRDALPRVQILGDSLTAGCCCALGDSRTPSGYAARLGARLVQSDYHVDILANAGKTATPQDSYCNLGPDWGPNFWQKAGWAGFVNRTAPDGEPSVCGPWAGAITCMRAALDVS
eukprot:SAG22_NODE_963_length_6279_cov_30.717314_2_plen_126_part_00